MPMPKLMTDFEAFARTKPAHEKYEYQRPKECACAQFALATGREKDYYGLTGDEKKLMDPEVGYPFAEAEIYAATTPHTWGALADRIRDEVHKDKFEEVEPA